MSYINKLLIIRNFLLNTGFYPACGSPWTREVGVTHTSEHEYTDSENEEKSVMARLMNVKSKSARVSQKCRVVDKSGYPNIQYKNISKRRRKYFSDLFTTLVDSRYLQFYPFELSIGI